MNKSNTSIEMKSNSYLTTSESEVQNTIPVLEEEKIGPQSFTVHALIGKGSFGEVYLVEKKDNGNYYAMKMLHKSKITSIE